MYMGITKLSGTADYQRWNECPKVKHAVWYAAHFRGWTHFVFDGKFVGNYAGVETDVSPDTVAFLAKDRSTLISALKVCHHSLKVTCRAGNLGYIVGSYDREKLGGLITNKISGLKGWKDFKNTDKGQKLLEAGGTKEDYTRNVDRTRLSDRGYFLVAAPASSLRHYKGHVALHDTIVPLCSFVGLLSGKMGREEAVDRLFEDLLVT